MNAIVRLTLNGMCEFVRGQKFSRQGLEQMQVDCAFMRQKLWICVGDEHMLNMSIEDVVTAAGIKIKQKTFSKFHFFFQ
jgi:hypothetical protein